MIMRPLFIALAMGACTTFPELDRTVTPALEAAPYPALVPLGPVLAQATTSADGARQANATLDARVAALKARAARLRGSVFNGPEQQRLAQGLQ